MPNYKHYRNIVAGGETAFVTTTVLGFVRAFERPLLKDEMAVSLCEDHIFYRAVLHAFVVMPHHVHYLCTLPPEHGVSWLLQRSKANSAKRIRPMLSPSEASLLGRAKRGEAHVFWEKNFRSFAVTENGFAQKVDYIHGNPVRAQLSTVPEDYAWSTAALFASGEWTWEHGLARALLERHNRRDTLDGQKTDTLTAASGEGWKVTATIST